MRARSRILVFSTALSLAMVSRPAGAQEVAAFVGAGSAGMPAVGRVNVASPRRAPQITAAAGVGYGYTEAQPGENGAHHRGFGTLGIGVQPLRVLAGSLILEGRFDKHPNDVLGSSTSAIGDPRLAVRFAEAISSSVALGAQVGFRVPGSEAPSVRVDASTVDAHALATISPPGSDFAVAFDVGYRVDRSAETIANPARVRRGDRIALNASAFDAVLMGAGVTKRVGRFELLGELTWEPLLGSGAPSAIESPLRLGAGTRFQVSDPGVMPDGIQAELRTEIALGERPGTLPLDPIAPLEPRVAFILGFRFTKAPARPTSTTIDAPPVVVQPPTVAPPVAVATGTVRGTITGDRGEPIANATVSAGDKSVSTAPDGSFTIETPAGKTALIVKATGYDDALMEVEVVAGAAATASVTAKHTIKPGQLRGLIRAWSGKALAATIRVEPIGVETTTDADGAFQIDVPPGSYEIIVAAPGFAGQRRRMQVEENGVTILNADLRPGK